MPSPDPLKVIQGRLAVASRKDKDPAKAIIARQNYDAARIEALIRSVELRPEQREHLAKLLAENAA